MRLTNTFCVIMLIGFLVILSLSTSAVIIDQNDIMMEYRFDGNLTDSSRFGNTGLGFEVSYNDTVKAIGQAYDSWSYTSHINFTDGEQQRQPFSNNYVIWFFMQNRGANQWTNFFNKGTADGSACFEWDARSTVTTKTWIQFNNRAFAYYPNPDLVLNSSLDFWTFVRNGTGGQFFVNGTMKASGTYTAFNCNKTTPWRIGRGWGNDHLWRGIIDELVFLNDTVLTGADVIEIFNGYLAGNRPTSYGISNYSFNVTNYADLLSNSTAWNTPNAYINVSHNNLTATFLLSKGANASCSIHNLNYTDMIAKNSNYKLLSNAEPMVLIHNFLLYDNLSKNNATQCVYCAFYDGTSSVTSGCLKTSYNDPPKSGFNISTVRYSNYITYATKNYTNNVTYNLTYICPWVTPDINDSALLLEMVNGAVHKTKNVSCNNFNLVLIDSITPALEGSTNLSFVINNFTTKNNTLIFDYNPPEVASISMQINGTGLGVSAIIANISVICNDSILPILIYNVTFNGVKKYSQNATTLSLYSSNQVMVTGNNNLTASCEDFWDRADVDLVQEYLTLSIINLIDEKNNIPLNVANLSIAKLYLDDNSSSFDFKNTNVSVTNYSTLNSSIKLRFEFGYYPSDAITTRYIDMALFPSGNIRVCGNLDNIVHQEQLLISASVRKALLKNIYSNCYVAGDYTRFAYQDAYSLKAFTIPSAYYLYAWDDDDNMITLASLDGSISSYVNLDTLDFKRTPYDFNVMSDALSFQPSTTDSTIIISYLNLADSNTALNLKIKRLDTNAELLDTSTFSNYNNFTIYFNYGVYTGITNSTLFQATLTKTTPSGSQTIVKYFNILAKSGILNSNLACVISLLLTIFGLSLTISRITFGWFGIFVEIFAIVILAVSTQIWYILLLEGINVIILVYIIIVLVQQNYLTISS